MKKKSSISPVVKTNVKYCGNGDPYFYVEVRFRKKEEIDALIKALRQLRDSKGDQFDHIHLQDTRLRPDSTVEGEINFWRPGVKRPGWERQSVTEAQRMFENLRSKEKKKT